MLRVYVAGPYRAKTTWGIHCNIHSAKMWGLEIARMGANPFVPHANTGYYDGEMDERFWLDADLEWLRLCDAIFVCPGYENSRGTIDEIAEAEAIGIPVFQTLGGLARLIDEAERLDA